MTQDVKSGSGRPRRRLRPISTGLAVLAVTAALDAVTIHRVFWFAGNFGTVEAGRAYRMAQPSGDDLRRLRARQRLASVLNLRGGSGADGFYREEVRAADDLGLDFYDLPMLADRRPSRAELLTLLDLFDRCRYPLLIHCKSGSDRTGLACGLYRMSRLGEPPERAVGAFSIAHGHVPLGGPERLQEPFREYARWLRERGLVHTPSRLREWVRREYRDEGPTEDEFIPVRPGPRPILPAVEAARGR